MTIDTILFDLDGTLVQHSHVLLPEKLTAWGYTRSAQQVDDVFAIQISWFYEYALHLQSIGQDTPQAWQRVWPLFYQRVAQALAIDDESIVGEMLRFFHDEPTPPLFEDTLPLLDWLAKDHWRLGVITQRGRAGAIRFLREHALLDRFQIIVAGDDGYGRKPAPDPFHQALGYLQCHAEHAIYVGDRIDDDCGGACGAGLRAFLIDRTGLHSETQSEHRFVRLTTLLELIEHLPPRKTIDG